MINQAQINDDVLAKTNEIITEVNTQGNDIGSLVTEVNDHDSKIMNLLSWMGLVKDYVIETGSNANGRYEKWFSGKLVCRGVFTATNGTTQAQGGIFRSESTQTQSYAMNFTEAPEVELKSQSYSAFDAMINSIAYNSFSFRLLHYANQTVDTPVLYVAEGRWK